MLDPGRYLAEAIYFLQYTLAQLIWSINRALLSIAVIVESVNSWLTENIGYFVGLLVNALSAPLGGIFILSLTALGFWYALNNIVPTERWVDPGKLFTYGLIAFFFFSSPIIVVDQMEGLRRSLNAGIDQALIDGAAGDIFDVGMNGTDIGLPAAIPDVNGDGVIGSFDLVAAFMSVGNINELGGREFPVDFEATFFPFGDPSSIVLTDEADRELAKSLASDGIERLFFSLLIIPTAIAEHFLRMILTGVAVFLYLGVPIAMLFAFFVYTQAFLGAYLRQFISLLVETFLSVIIMAVMIGLLTAAGRRGAGLFIGASIITFIVFAWRIKSAMRLATTAFDLFGGSMLTGGAGGMEIANMGKQAVAGTVGLAGAALTGGAAVALGGAALASASALQTDGRANGAYMGTDPAKTAGRAHQLKAIAGYTLGWSESVRHAVEGAHEIRTLGRNFRDGEAQPYEPDTLDYLRAGSSMSGFGSSPWLAMRLSPSLRAAYDQIGGRRREYDLLAEAIDDDGAIVDGDGIPRPPAGSAGRGQGDSFASLERAIVELTETIGRRQDVAGEQANIATVVSDWGGVRDATVAFDVSGSGHNAGEGAVGSAAATDIAAATTGAVYLEGATGARREAIHAVLEQLQDPDSVPGQAAYQTLVTFAGENNAGLLRTAVGHHSAGAAQAAAEATGDLVARYRANQMSDADILAAFQSGAAGSDLREALSGQGEPSPLSDEQLTAVADMVLLPQRRLTRGELAVVIGQQAAAGATSDQAVAEAIGSPVNFGGQTGAIRGALAGAAEMNLSPDEMARLAGMISDGLREAVQAELAGRGHRPDIVRDFVSDMASLPGTMTVPQTAARQPQRLDEE